MRVVTRQAVVAFIRARGGRLYVWADLMLCTGRKCILLVLARAAHRAARVPAVRRRGFDLFFRDEGLEAPVELRPALGGWRKKRVSVYEGFSWVMEDEPPEGR